MLSSYVPIITPQKALHEQMAVSKITSQAFEARSMMAKCDPHMGKYRGDVIPTDVSAAVSMIKTKKNNTIC